MGYTHYFWRKPELDKDKFAEAVADCKKLCEASGVALAYEYDEPEKLPLFDHDLVRFNGVGDDGYETFVVPLVADSRTWGQVSDDGRVFAFCKTACKPYDLAVTGCLLVFKHHFGENFTVSSDGDAKDWKPAQQLCLKVLGWKLSRFLRE